MNKPIVKVKEKEYSVSNISVVLKVNSGSLIHLRLSEKLDGTEHKLSNEEAFKQEFFQDICREEEGSFQWGGTTLKFILVGSNSSEGSTFELVGLAVKKDLIEWFNQNNFKDNKQDYLIYQKTKGKNSWDFLEKAIGNKFQKPNQDFVERLKLLFPENGCIWRYKDSNNFHFLNRAIAFASRHLPEVQGWCAFDADKPLRLILFEEKKQDRTIPKLDSTWNAFDLFLPNRYSWNRWLDRSCTLSRDLDLKPGQEIALIEQLVSHGSNEDEQKGLSFQGQNPTRLLFVPGTINIGDKNIFCHTVSYDFKLPAFDTESPSVTMKIELDYPERQIGDNEVVSLRLPGKFKAWEQETDEETQVKIAPSDEFNNWGIIDEKDQSIKSGGDAVLFTQILSPTYSDKKYSGIYIKHEQDDEMIVDIHPCGVPLALGSVQKYRKELEEADITLCGEKLAISVSPHNQKLADSEAIILDNSEIKLNHGKKIFGQAQQQVDFLSQNIELGSSQLNINSANTQIKSLVNISFPSPKVPTPNIPSTLGVAGTSDSESKTNKSSSSNAGNSSSKSSQPNSALSQGNSESSSQQVLMKTIDGSTKPLQITPDTKISEIKEMLGYESADVYLVHGGKRLDENATVADYPNIQKDSTIETRGRLRGGDKKRKWDEGTYGDRTYETKRIKKETGYEVKGNTHEYEHVIRDSVTREGYEPSGAGRKKDKGDLEKTGYAYAETKAAHRKHPGTGNNTGNNLSGMSSSEYSKTQSEALRGSDEPDIHRAVAINQLGYAHTPEFVEKINTEEGKVATNSYANMVNNMKDVKYAGGEGEIESVQVPPEQKAQMLADRKSAETGIYHEATTAEDGSPEIRPIPEANNSRNIKDEHKWAWMQVRKKKKKIEEIRESQNLKNRKQKLSAAEKDLKEFEDRWRKLMELRGDDV
ncbi:ubiquitin-like protein [Myxosarcina sp. GI1]|uniref:ubiquitin-like protein n=1 Tax=Myxosarcina sp. GI1 TaxID=1541065 RepID=UPI0005620250|nr:ubiquitin-like protein [Myxosarcina sp. GI1]